MLDTTGEPFRKPAAYFSDRTPYPERIEDWFSLCEDLPYLRRACSNGGAEPVPPKPMSKAELLGLVGSLLDVDHAQVLRVLLLDLIGPDLARLIDASR